MYDGSTNLRVFSPKDLTSRPLISRVSVSDIPGAKRERTPHADHQRFRGAGDGDFEAGRRGGSGIRTADAAVRICQAALRPLRNVVPLSGKCKISARTVQNLDETFTSMVAPDCRCPCRQFFLLQAQGNPNHRGIMRD